MIVTFTLLTLAVLALWLGPPPFSPRIARFAWPVLFLGAVIAALASGIVRPPGLLWMGAFATATAAFAHARAPRAVHFLAGLAILTLAAGLMTHSLPGFANPRMLDGVRFTPDALPFRLHLNFDKTVVGLFLLGVLHPRIARASEWRAMLVAAAPVAALTFVVLITLSLMSGYVRFAPKLPPATALFFWVNLCFTCIAEEALFRGFIQARLAHHWRDLRFGAGFALALAAVLFGLAHAAGGPAYVVLSTIAGVGYGWAYLRSGGRIEASILTHFAVNALHFVGFTYPTLAR